MPDLVVSGINHGANLGDDVLYSGTVAAASEGRALGLPAIAASCQSFAPEYLESAAYWVEWLIRRLDNHPLPAYSLFNVNVPDAPLEKIAGVQATRLGRRHPSGQLVRDTDPRGREIVWIGAAGEAEDAGEGTDFHALAHGWVSVTPIHFDMTRHETMPALETWLA
jgi:5'-nucleotidase